MPVDKESLNFSHISLALASDSYRVSTGPIRDFKSSLIDSYFALLYRGTSLGFCWFLTGLNQGSRLLLVLDWP